MGTKAQYVSDWNLMEQMFTTGDSIAKAYRGSGISSGVMIIWDVMKPMKKSIFDEFDLRNEAEFTQKGQKMLVEFTQLIDAGEYAPSLEPGSIKLTTPNAVATTSPY